MAVVLLTAMMMPFAARACDGGSVRMAMFAEKRDMHKLCLIGHAGDPVTEQLYTDLAARFAAASDFNVELVRVDADDPATNWRALGLPSAPPELPVTVLVGWDGVEQRPFFISHWAPAPTAEEFAAMIESPAREFIKRNVIGYWAVILYARGTGEADAVVDAVAKKWAVDQPPGVSVARLDRADPAESLLRAFIGLRPDGPDWLGVIVGRGKLLAPPLEGGAITEENVNKLVGGLLAPCTCLQTGVKIGVDIPMTWAAALDKSVVALGDDGYLETGIKAAAIPAPPAASSRVASTAVYAIAGSILVIMLASAIVLLKGRSAE